MSKMTNIFRTPGGGSIKLCVQLLREELFQFLYVINNWQMVTIGELLRRLQLFYMDCYKPKEHVNMLLLRVHDDRIGWVDLPDHDMLLHSVLFNGAVIRVETDTSDHIKKLQHFGAQRKRKRSEDITPVVPSKRIKINGRDFQGETKLIEHKIINFNNSDGTVERLTSLNNVKNNNVNRMLEEDTMQGSSTTKAMKLVKDDSQSGKNSINKSTQKKHQVEELESKEIEIPGDKVLSKEKQHKNKGSQEVGSKGNQLPDKVLSKGKQHKNKGSQEVGNKGTQKSEVVEDQKVINEIKVSNEESSISSELSFVEDDPNIDEANNAKSDNSEELINNEQIEVKQPNIEEPVIKKSKRSQKSKSLSSTESSIEKSDESLPVGDTAEKDEKDMNVSSSTSSEVIFTKTPRKSKKQHSSESESSSSIAFKRLSKLKQGTKKVTVSESSSTSSSSSMDLEVSETKKPKKSVIQSIKTKSGKLKRSLKDKKKPIAKKSDTKKVQKKVVTTTSSTTSSSSEEITTKKTTKKTKKTPVKRHVNNRLRYTSVGKRKVRIMEELSSEESTSSSSSKETAASESKTEQKKILDMFKNNKKYKIAGPIDTIQRKWLDDPASLDKNIAEAIARSNKS
eukprot:TRINITY_DN1713_c0_g1_i1.p1 TRINITY_DN1713_c0_g1~~TRINITY_DN1713_c0_g1_i1.p1  ORF type:complete len:629 (-),score=161.10 TRINITY_DN1713_c0_g1_i1:1506-3371(-)